MSTLSVVAFAVQSMAGKIVPSAIAAVLMFALIARRRSRKAKQARF